MTEDYADSLIRRRQFVLGPAYLEPCVGWQRLKVAEFCLTAHPELNVCQALVEGRSLTLLGFILDPDRPERSDREILDDLAGRLARDVGFSDWIRFTYSLAGRWILIVDDGLEARLVSDALGLRQAFYSLPGVSAQNWCASRPGLIAEALGLDRDPVAQRDYVESRAFQSNDEPVWPGDTTPYAEVRHLLPNHVLELRTGTCRRFWPDAPLGTTTVAAVADRSAATLRGVLAAASRRFPLALGLSAGWDSRVLLAASRDLASRIHFYTFTHGEESVDEAVASQLLASLGLVQHRLPVPERMGERFAGRYERHITPSRPFNGRFVQAFLNHMPTGMLNVTGNAAETVRVRFRLPPGQALTARLLAGFTSFHAADGFDSIRLVRQAWQRWLDGLGDTYDLNVLDLFYWEHYGGNFAGTDQAEVDMAIETLTPYNCRSLLACMLAAPEADREHRHPRLYVEIIQRLWPEVLALPVNPSAVTAATQGESGARSGAHPGLSQRIRASAIAALRATGLYGAAKTLRDRIRGGRHD